MSDGNFNRALLPSTPYASGVRMGQQQMRTKAIEALRQIMAVHFPSLTAEETEELVKSFTGKL